MGPHIFEIHDIGRIKLVKSRKARNLVASLEATGDIRVAVPYWASFKEAEKMITARNGWIKKYLSKMEKARHKHKQLIQDLPIVSDRKAKNIIMDRYQYLVMAHNFDFGLKVTFRRQRTRWGSCSAKNNISLNLKLARLPESLIDYVILHELAHTKIRSHKQPFWTELSKYIQNPKKSDKQLRGYTLSML
jgi:predicted metal-dependent hydrolase